MLRGKRDQEMSTPNPQGPQSSSQQLVKQEGQEQNRVIKDKTSSPSQGSSNSENLDLEEIMEQTEVKTVHQSETTKEP